MNNPFAETPKDLLVGALVGLVLTGALVGAKELLTDDPPSPSAWLTETDQEFLAAALDEVPTSDEWIAGCLWQDRDPADIHKVVRLPGGTATTWRSATPGRRRISLVSVADAAKGQGFDSIEGPGYFCYVPER